MESSWNRSRYSTWNFSIDFNSFRFFWGFSWKFLQGFSKNPFLSFRISDLRFKKVSARPDHNVEAIMSRSLWHVFFLQINVHKLRCVIASYVPFSQGPCGASACFDSIPRKKCTKKAQRATRCWLNRVITVCNLDVPVTLELIDK